MNKQMLNRVWCAAAFAAVMLAVNYAAAGSAGALGGGFMPGMPGGGGMGGMGGNALASLSRVIQSNVATVASIGIMGIAMYLAFAKSGWMDMVGAISFVVVLGLVSTWAASSTGTFFGAGGLV